MAKTEGNKQTKAILRNMEHRHLRCCFSGTMENAYLFQGHKGTGTSDQLNKGIYSKKEETGSHKYWLPLQKWRKSVSSPLNCKISGPSCSKQLNELVNGQNVNCSSK